MNWLNPIERSFSASSVRNRSRSSGSTPTPHSISVGSRLQFGAEPELALPQDYLVVDDADFVTELQVPIG